jgi:putative FmdB family regulatory protein
MKVVPIYEFYCSPCHTIFSFFASRPEPNRKPSCPRCGQPELERRPSRFATRRSRPEGEGPTSEGETEFDPFAQLDEATMERAMDQLVAEFGDLEGEGPEEPQALARFLRRFTQLTGLEAGPKLEHLLERLERGEDPEALENEFGEEGEGDEDLAELFRSRKEAVLRRLRKPRTDETLYFFD